MLDIGDMLVYSGCELEHWREPFEGNTCGTRPYGEVVKLMNSLSTLTPVDLNGGEDVRKK